MKYQRIAKSGERFVPHKYGDGKYRMADPSSGAEKHHSKNELSVDENEIEDFLSRGFSLRMKGQIKGKSNLISPSKIQKA